MAGLSIVRALNLALALSVATMASSAAETVSTTDLIRVETGASSGITVRLAEDIANLVDDGTTRRMIPVVGQGGMQGIADLLEGRGVDLAFLQLDVLDHARAQKLYP